MSGETQPRLEPEPEDNQTPPVPQLADVPPEEWDYSTGQAFAGCGVIGAVVLAIILPITLGIFMESPWSQLIGFGVPGLLAIVCVTIIGRMTQRKRQERRAERHSTTPGDREPRIE